MKTPNTSKAATAKKTTSPSKQSSIQKASLNTTDEAKSAARKSQAKSTLADSVTDEKRDIAGSEKSPDQNTLPTDGKSAVTSFHAHPDEIATRAYKIWQQQGCPEGCEEQHWRQAEQEILREGSCVLVP